MRPLTCASKERPQTANLMEKQWTPFDWQSQESIVYSRRMPILGAMTVHFPFEHTYAALPANFFARVVPTPVASPRLIKLNRLLAIHLGLDPDRLARPGGTEILAGKRVPDGADPIAMAN